MSVSRKVPSRAASPAERIVRAATALFARNGFEGTTTRMIAERARINEALIFRHFPNKRRLYAAIIERKIASDPILGGLADGNPESTGVETVLRTLAQRVLRTIREDPQFLRLLYFSGLENHSLSSMFFDTYSQCVSRFLASRLEAAMKTGELRTMEPFLCARAFMGMVAHHALAGEIFKLDANRWPEEELVETFVSLFLHGLRK
jgi:AcrR family transcriptional regulator